MSYIIDFERVNHLTSCINDNPKDGINGLFVYNTSRRIVKEYLDIYIGVQSGRQLECRDYLNIVQTLLYNKILIDVSEIRDKKIGQILQ